MSRIHEAPDYWVPENFMYTDSEDCMDEHPECPAVGLFDEGWQAKYDKAIAIIEKEREISTSDSASSTWERLTKGLLQLGEL